MGHKRMRISREETDYDRLACYTSTPGGPVDKRQKDALKVFDYSDPFSFPDLLDGLDSGKYGSVTQDIKDLCARRMQMLNPYFVQDPTLLFTYFNVEKIQSKEALKLENQGVIDLEDNSVANKAALPVVILDSDDENDGDQKPSYPYHEVFLGRPVNGFPSKDLVVADFTENNALKEDDRSLSGEFGLKNDKGVYVGVQDDLAIEEGSHQIDAEDGLADIWNEMTVALECSKDVAEDPLSDEHASEDGEDCDHSFVLKDDLGRVCRICGLVYRGIESIFVFDYLKPKTTRTYKSESRNRESTEVNADGIKLSEHEFIATEISAHPRHRKQMKPHQVEGFNFLTSNLVADNPGGCILAHAPGSGKTFMIISFMQSFLARYPHARPLVVLPKGILGTWKREFQIWQVEDLPLLDLYTAKADSRSQQLHILKQWVEQKSILFLGYKQFSSIICDSANCTIAASCQKILLEAPSILILDEGHTPRNENTDVFDSLAKVQTPRKVVLSGTLYQNHVKEVFNILNLVRPKFLRTDASRVIKKRIMSRVHISGVRKQVKSNAELAFFDLVEHTLQKDEDFRRKINVIQDLREMTSKVLHYYKGDFSDELPGLEDFTVLLNLSARQKPLVKELKRFTRKFKRTSVGSAVYMHPQLKSFAENLPADGEKLSSINDEKMDEMLRKIDIRDGVKAKFFLNMLSLCESAGEKLLIFSQYLQPLKFLERLSIKVKGWRPGKETFMITGDSSSEVRECYMDRFNNSSDAKIFFGSIKACGEGISLVGASRILILDVHLNPSVTRQAIGRAFRPGQKRKVYTYRLVAADSPEEEDHLTCFNKELISKMWFEWNEYTGQRDFDVKTVDIDDCGDLFLESALLREDVKVLYRRWTA